LKSRAIPASAAKPCGEKEKYPLKHFEREDVARASRRAASTVVSTRKGEQSIETF
jgi:hypothetical protein